HARASAEQRCAQNEANGRAPGRLGRPGVGGFRLGIEWAPHRISFSWPTKIGQDAGPKDRGRVHAYCRRMVNQNKRIMAGRRPPCAIERTRGTHQRMLEAGHRVPSLDGIMRAKAASINTQEGPTGPADRSFSVAGYMLTAPKAASGLH